MELFCLRQFNGKSYHLQLCFPGKQYDKFDIKRKQRGEKKHTFKSANKIPNGFCFLKLSDFY